ncbi:MAG: hypothetical protein LBU74_02030 [Methanobacteriaceae archaeon]|jgi:hypothetical protein|nr:hypothetical protein [Candidatus Methanorudis spinitermitis]
MESIKILINDSLVKKIKGKQLINWNITSENEIELEFDDECELFKRLEKAESEIKTGKGIKLDADDFDKRYGL